MNKKKQSFDFEDKFASDYEELASIIIPAYKEIYLLAASYLQSHLKKEASILSVGCGSGIELISLAQTNKQWKITGVDSSLAMLAMANKKLQVLSLSEQIQLHHGTLDKMNFSVNYDAITCFFLLHILNDEVKLNLLKQIFSYLKPNALFIMVDSIAIENPLYNIDVWKNYVKRRGLPKEKMTQIIEHSEKDRFISSADKLLALTTEAGFDNSFLFYSALCYSGWILKK